MHRFMNILFGCFVVVLGSASAAVADIRLNTLGFLPDYDKKATIVSACSDFAVIDAKSGKTVFDGEVTGPFYQKDVDQEVWIADFSPVRKKGRYYLEVPGVGRSVEFPVGEGVYDFAYYTAMRAFYLWRCGTAVEGVHEGQRFAQAACHLDDAYLDFVGPDSSRRDATGGWHDAGDYNKYVVNAGITVGNLFLAWEDFMDPISRKPLDLPETAPGYPDFLKELKGETDWLLKMQLDSGKVSHKISAMGFCGFIMPDEERDKRYFTDWSSTATADFCAMMAMASRIFRPYDPQYADSCLRAAELSYAFLKAHPDNKRPNQRAFRTGGYGSPDPDDRLWAAAELWESTGNPDCLEDFETRAAGFEKKIIKNWDWAEVRNLGMLTYYFSGREGKNPETVGTIRAEIIAVADTIVRIADGDVYGRPLGGRYYWGCNGGIARQAVILQAANRISPDPGYINAVLDAAGHLFGRNVYGRSFVTGLGHRPPMHPHDRRSGADGVEPPWPGYVVGGGHSATDWQDAESDYRTNEIAINWQAALVYLLAGFLSGQENQ
ncbi:MAG TPA: endoglucanase [bacterium]|nr:endoglucanase [bacterium]